MGGSLVGINGNSEEIAAIGFLSKLRQRRMYKVGYSIRIEKKKSKALQTFAHNEVGRSIWISLVATLSHKPHLGHLQVGMQAARHEARFLQPTRPTLRLSMELLPRRQVLLNKAH
jgi:hypothetical protein